MKNIYLKYQWPAALFLLALALTFVPMMVSAANTALNILGLVVLVGVAYHQFKVIKHQFLLNSTDESSK